MDTNIQIFLSANQNHQRNAGGLYLAGLTPAFTFSEEFRLFCLVAFLIFDVGSDGKFIDADGGDKIATIPESALRKFFGFLFDPRTTFSFHYCYSISDRILGWDSKIYMNVFISHMPRVNFKIFPSGNHLEYSF